MRLTALTLVGFKSFADKTTFDFPEGVTCVVGPNGCGKSNLVDAFKWVLGEQSAKSLRGGEMLDVIFNGTAQRRSASYAEITLTFADAAGLLAPHDADGADTIKIARRLYRSGESEYRINGQIARLKDIREMFMDTGVGVNAYSLIEQGKVDAFLQASGADRRAVFDEAAGISKYKARKRETLRRLERVEQNLLRLTDILGEVQKRLRSIKYQAGKARSYQAHSTRLRELRALFSLAEYHRLSAQRRDQQAQADALTDAAAKIDAQIHRLEASAAATETEKADLEQTARALDARIAALTGEITACTQRAEMLAARGQELADAVATDVGRREKLEARVETNRREVAARRNRLTALDGELRQLAQREQMLQDQADHVSGAAEQLRAGLDDEKNGVIDLLRRTAELHNEINTQSLRRKSLHTQRERLAGRAEEIARSLESVLVRRAGEQARLDDVARVLADSQQTLDQTHAHQRDLDAAAQAIDADLTAAKEQHSALTTRQSLLQEMQRRREGVGEGVRRALAAAREGRIPSIRGMLGDFLATDVGHAAVIEAALAGAEQYLLVDALDDAMASAGRIKALLGDSGGVEVMALDAAPAASGADASGLPAGVIARAADWVRCNEEYRRLVEALLGRTLVVASLGRALEIAQAEPGRWRVVTTAGEVLEPDGRLRIGGPARPAGVISRASELADLAVKQRASQARMDQLASKARQVRARRSHAEEVLQSLRTAVYEAHTERVEHQAAVERLDERIAELQREAPLVAEEVRQLVGEIETTTRNERAAQAAAEALEQQRTDRESEMTRLTAAFEQAQKRHQALTGEVTAAKIALAEARQKRDALHEAHRDLFAAGEALAQEMQQVEAQIETARTRRAEAEAGAAEARRKAQTLVADKATALAEAEEVNESRRSLDERLAEVRTQLAADRKRHDELAAQANEVRVRLGEVEVRIETLIARTAEEIGMDLPAAFGDYAHDEQRDWDAVRTEIVDLRAKIERLGNVNLDAIAEQDELQQRAEFLDAQIADVRASERQLMDLIKRINAESRRRFEEALQAVRDHFNDLFRKLFGGGKADVILMAPDDPLESAIEIVARPPGKELRSITLLSGGEKTLTALALLLSFFKARPTPFCLLDEVDAALDETNTERFVRLVREFLSDSQFIIISHAKRTIALADQIYGVTMQEAGVSKRIAVKFDQAAELAETPDKAAVVA